MPRGYELVRVILALLLTIGLSAPVSLAQAEDQYQVLAFNNLGMHCMDGDFSVFSLLPPFNTVRAQLVLKGPHPVLLDNKNYKVMFNAIPDPQGSINTTSAGKTNFWQYISALFGPSFSNWQADVGILGIRMPGLSNTLREVRDYNPTYKWFEAPGIPLTNLDDSLKTNSFPMMRIQAYQKGDGTRKSRFLDSLDIVTPVSSEMNCASCHETAAFADYVNTFSDASPPPRIGPMGTNLLQPESFSSNPDPQVRFRENILILHDALSQTNLMGQYQAGTPVLCASCHYSKALDLAGNNQPTGNQVGHLYLSRAIHKHHGTAWPMMDGTYVIPIPGAYTPGAGPSTCYYCHPGNDTQCLRSVMAVKGMSCQSCHGDLLAVGGFTTQLSVPGFVDPYLPNVSDPSLAVKLKTTKAQRRPWQDMPKCQSCHWGDAMNHYGGRTVGIQAYLSTDEAATPILAPNSRFKENDDLYQTSTGHGGVACQACHGSTHAEWPARINTNDNVTAMQLQGHTGEIAECGVCHDKTLGPTLGGPHGLHNINDSGWVAQHGPFYRQNPAACQACHRADLKGSILSVAKADRYLPTSISKGGVKIHINKGTGVNCYACHTTIQ